MSRHDGVSCDACLKSSFRGRRFKCLRCYDYDLCGTCFDDGVTTSRHTADHPMQCILTRVDQDLYFGSDPGGGNPAFSAHSFTCPLCGNCGFTETTLTEHCLTDHAGQTSEVSVICPICSALPRGEPNNQTQDLVSHLQCEHRLVALDSGGVAGVLSSNSNEFPPGSSCGGSVSSSSQLRSLRQTARRGGASACRSTTGSTLGLVGSRHSVRGGTAASATASQPSSAASWASSDPIAELLTQLSNVRSRGSVQNQLAQLEQQVQATRAHLERLPIFRHDSRLDRLAMGAASAVADSVRSSTALAAISAGGSLSREEIEAVMAAAVAGSGPGMRLSEENMPNVSNDELDLFISNDDKLARGLLSSMTADEDDETTETFLRTAFMHDLLMATLCQPLT